MTKKVSAIIFLTMLLFVLTAFSTSSIHSQQIDADVFGYPFIFFSSNATATETSFSLLGLLGNLSLYGGISYMVVTSIIKLQAFGDRSKNNFKTFP